MQFQDKVVLVTGGSRGIGRRIVEEFAARGARVIINHSGARPGAARELAATIGAEQAEEVAADVADEGAVREMVAGIRARHGRLDIVVNNAGICPFRHVLEVTAAEFRRILDVNATAVFLVATAAARVMKDHGGGRIVNVTSISGLRVTNPRQVAYCTSKAAANMLTRALAVTLAPYGITVNAVLPGTVPTDINRDVLAQPGVAESIVEATPLRALGDTQDVASAVLYLAGPEAEWITGSLLVVDGGFVA
jgi:NAD(P)-dependent dehydrogenase (short-subunit alcohol dehydrogenase family)